MFENSTICYTKVIAWGGGRVPYQVNLNLVTGQFIHGLLGKVPGNFFLICCTKFCSKSDRSLFIFCFFPMYNTLRP